MKLGSRQQLDKLRAMTEFQSFSVHATLLDRSTVYKWGSPSTKGSQKKYRDRDAKAMFSNILGYMGDSQHPYPDTLAVELVNAAVDSMSMASEIFAQIMKQLTANPSPASTERGWQLFAILLEY